MRRTLLHSASYDALLARAMEPMRAWSRNSEVVILGATRSAATDAVRRSCDGGLLGLHALTLPQLAASLASARIAELGLSPASRLGTEAVVARVVHALLKDGKLKYFHPVAAMPGFARALASTLTELRFEGIAPAQLAKTGSPGIDLSLLLGAYERQLEERSIADLPLLFRLAAEADSHRLLGLPLVLLDPPLDSKAHRDLLAAVAARSPSTLALVLTGDDTGKLAALLGVAAEAVEPEGPGNALGRARRFLFSTAKPPAGAQDESLAMFSAPGEGLECVEMARRVRKLAAGGVPFDRMAILVRRPDRYQPLVEEALRRAGAPAYYTRGSMRPDPAGRAFLALLECASERCSASRFAEYLSLGQTPPLDESGAPPAPKPAWAPPDDEVLAIFQTPAAGQAPEPEPVVATLATPIGWEKLLVDAAVIGGADRWERRLRGLENEFRLQLQDLRAEDDPRRAHIERQLELLRNLERFALPLISFLAALPPRARWRDWLERLRDLASMSLRRPDSVLSVLSELDPMDEVGPVDIDEVSGVLSDRLRFLRREPPPRRYGQVFVGTPDEARGRSFDVVFVPGLAEGLFPRRALEDPLLLDESRRKIGSGLALLDDRVARERLLLHTAAAAARDRLVVSYPRMDSEQSRPRVPSFYALEVIRAAEGRLPDLRVFEKRATEAAPARLGWPAPVDPREAVDDAEYDLACLLEPLRKNSKEKGSGNYLVKVNSHLARSLRARWRRWKPAWSAADGLIAPDANALAALAQHRLRQRPYSASALQQYAACPYRFLLHAIHQLRPREEPVALEQMDPLTRGALFHEVQFGLFRALEKEGLLPMRRANLASIVRIADEVLNRVARDYQERLAPAIPRVWNTEVEDLRSDLRGWIHQATIDSPWQPLRFEFGFGLSGQSARDRDPRSVPQPAEILNGLKIRGSIDLVERHVSNGTLRVVDHKTGKPPDPIPASVGGGQFLQPLLYSLAAEKLLNETVASGLLSYCTQRGNYTDIEIAVTAPARRRLEHALQLIDGAIETGFLPPAPAKGACEFCDYRAVCGPYEEQRAQRKQRDDRLEPLQELRNLL